MASFKRKVEKKIISTRGLFVTMIQPRTKVLAEFARAGTSTILLMDGADLALILEGQVSLTDALYMKARKAAQEGVIFFSLGQRFG